MEIKRIPISSCSKPVYNCMECNKKLTEYEYNRGYEICTSCRNIHYDRNRRMEYIDINGNNKIDEILIKKRERGAKTK